MADKLDLEKIRQRIDELDTELVKILEERLEVVLDVAAYKKAKGLPVRDLAREGKVLSKAKNRLQCHDYDDAIVEIMSMIMEQSRALEHRYLDKADQFSQEGVLDVGCFGVPGSFSHQALEEYFKGRNINRKYYSLFEEVVQAVKQGEIKYGILPIENSSTGGINEVYDLLRKHDCSIVGEKCIKIEQNLLGIPGAKLEDITMVYSHPQGFAQSKEFLARYPKIKSVPYFNTSKSAEKVSQMQDPHSAAIAGEQAAELYGLEVLASNINYNSNNYTRFVIIANEVEIPENADKITVVIAIKHETGSLYQTLCHFYLNEINMMNLESRPIEGKSWEYFFHIDLAGNLAEKRVREAIDKVMETCAYCKILGNYKADIK